MKQQLAEPDPENAARRRIGPERRHLAAVELASRSCASLRRTARRYSLCVDDAEDAYQRSLEILLEKAPTDDLRQLRPWLHTVIKHEALAVRAQRERMLGAEPDDTVGGSAPGPDERAPERERAHRTAEALGQLKHSEIQCMLLQALGYSYNEIAGRTGYSWTKVNRSLTEGRKRFFARYDEIGSGVSCGRLAPALVAAAEGGLEADERRRLGVHVEGCASCRASLRARRETPVHSMELLTPALLLPALRGGWWSRLHETTLGALVDRLGLVAGKFQQLLEAASAQKTAVAVASTAALAGGVAAERQVQPQPHSKLVRAQTLDREHAARPEPRRPQVEPQQQAAPESRVAPASAEQEPAASQAQPAEFEPTPEPAAPATSRAPAAPDRSEPTQAEEFAP